MLNDYESRGHREPDASSRVGRIELFARISGDRNPIHFDADLAARSRFGGIIVQGGVTSA
jgi:acyl dehydratase